MHATFSDTHCPELVAAKQSLARASIAQPRDTPALAWNRPGAVSRRTTQFDQVRPPNPRSRSLRSLLTLPGSCTTTFPASTHSRSKDLLPHERHLQVRQPVLFLVEPTTVHVVSMPDASAYSDVPLVIRATSFNKVGTRRLPGLLDVRVSPVSGREPAVHNVGARISSSAPGRTDPFREATTWETDSMWAIWPTA